MPRHRARDLAEAIAAAIEAGRIGEGDRLGTKEHLRRDYNVAHGILNEALQLLAKRGFIVSRTGPGGGLFARKPSWRQSLAHLVGSLGDEITLAECLDARQALEAAVVADALRSRSLDDVVELQRSAAGPYWALHRRIAACCANRVLAHVYLAILDACEAANDMPDAAAEARVAAIVDAIATGDTQERTTLV